MEFLESKINMAGELINWHPLAKKPYKNKGQSLWAKMTDANMATTAFRGAMRSVGKMGARMSRDSKGGGGSVGFSLADIGKEALAEIDNDESASVKNLSSALEGMTTVKDDTTETGVTKPQVRVCEERSDELRRRFYGILKTQSRSIETSRLF